MVSIDQEKNGASVIFVLECYECKNQLVKPPHKTYITARPICLSKKKKKVCFSVFNFINFIFIIADGL